MKYKKGEWAIIIFNALYLLAFLIYFIKTGNLEFIWYIFTILIIGLVFLFTIRKSKLSYLTLWLLSFWGLIHMIAGGLIVNGETLYSLRIIDIIDKGGQFFILKMDQLIHFYGFAVAGLMVYELLHYRAKKEVSPGFLIFISVIGSIGLGALNEVVEFIALISLEATGVGDIYNLGLDLIFNLFGATFGAFAGYLWKR